MDLITLVKNFRELISCIEETIHHMRTQNFFYGQLSFKRILSILETLPKNYTEHFFPSLEGILSAQQSLDYLLMADLLEIQLLSACKDELLQLVSSSEEEFLTNHLDKNLALLKDEILAKKIRNNTDHALENNYFNVAVTNNGLFTLEYTNGASHYFYHSNTNPYKEGVEFARHYSQPDVYDYTILGFGFGYHILGFLDIDKRNTVKVIETNLDALTLAFIYTDLSDLLSNEAFSITYCDEESLSSCISGNFIIHHPSFRTLPQSPVKKLLNDYFLRTNSMMSNSYMLDCNLHFNLKRNDEPVDNVLECFGAKPAIYIGGGPSLEYYIDYLKECSTAKSHTIICASTCYRNLITRGIIPDFVMIIDPKERMLSHMLNTFETRASLIYLCTASKAAIDAFMGKRYICFQKGYKQGEEHANEHNLLTIETGGSVSTAAIDLLLKAGCKNITTIGLDLANTDGKRHSFDTEKTSNAQPLIPVRGVNGDTVYTTDVLNLHRKWIENRISEETNVSFTNMSHGAYINGMTNIF